MSLTKTIKKLFGDPKKKVLKRIQALVSSINEQEKRYQEELHSDQISQKTQEFKTRIAAGESLDDLLIEAFALVKYACRTLLSDEWKMVPYDVQIMGAIALHEGRIAEMKTGEGKTLCACLPIYLNALSGKGVHVVTVNEYLAERDALWMKPLFQKLGLSVGVLKSGVSRIEKRTAYTADVTYGTNTEFGFDYLRDNMSLRQEDQVQRELSFAIVDEVDSVLIDEARTPLMISGPSDKSTDKYEAYAKLVQKLDEGTDYTLDEKQKTASLTEAGISKMEELLGVENLYTEGGFREVYQIEQALKALGIYKKDVDYVVRDNEVILIDEFTGRLMPGRRLGRGLHQAIEAKECVPIKRESRTLATITLQNYFRMYAKLTGMTGTAETEEEEFEAIYGLSVLPIPTHQKMQRIDKTDLIYKNQKAKFEAITQMIAKIHATGQPVLIGTTSVQKSEYLSDSLKKRGIPHEVLNAKNHAREAEIITKAGEKNAVTIATNMAGRGVDIKLGEGSAELGGLVIIGSERHESRRIDNQLRGRSGRQGDPGISQFFVAMDDDLMRIFGGSRMESMMERLNLPDDTPIEMGLLSRFIEGSQQRIEGHYFDIRKHLVEYDSVMNRHRDIVYSKRNELLASESLENQVLVLIEQEAESLVLSHPEELEILVEQITTLHKEANDKIQAADLADLDTENRIQKVKAHLIKAYQNKCQAMGEEKLARQAEKMILLRVLDHEWANHLTELQEIRQAVSLLSYGQRSPLMEYKNQAFESFEKLMNKLDHEWVKALFHVRIQVKDPNETASAIPMANPFEHITTNENQIEENISGKTKAAKSDPQETLSSDKHGRNDPCPCGSGKKYKKCHGAS